MTRKTFILAGLFAIALGSLSAALQSYLLLSQTIPTDSGPYYLLFSALVTPVGFGLLLWKRLRTVGRSKRFTAFSFFGLLVTFYFALIFPVIAWIGLDTSSISGAIISNEIGAWASSGREGVIIFTLKAKLQVAILLAIDYLVGYWPLFVALYLAALDPRFPKGDSQLKRLLNRIFTTHRTITSPINKTANLRQTSV